VEASTATGGPADSGCCPLGCSLGVPPSLHRRRGCAGGGGDRAMTPPWQLPRSKIALGQSCASKILAIVLAALAVAGCRTPYQDGVAVEQMTADTFRIVARGNSHTTIQDYTALKAAEITKAKGGTHFLIVSVADASSTSYVVDSQSIDAEIRPGRDTHIRVLTVQSGHAPPAGAQSADEIIQFVGGRVSRAG
jgi:hypothetical protein